MGTIYGPCTYCVRGAGAGMVRRVCFAAIRTDARSDD